MFPRLKRERERERHTGERSIMHELISIMSKMAKQIPLMTEAETHIHFALQILFLETCQEDSERRIL